MSRLKRLCLQLLGQSLKSYISSCLVNMVSCLKRIYCQYSQTRRIFFNNDKKSNSFIRFMYGFVIYFAWLVERIKRFALFKVIKQSKITAGLEESWQLFTVIFPFLESSQTSGRCPSSHKLYLDFLRHNILLSRLWLSLCAIFRKLIRFELFTLTLQSEIAIGWKTRYGCSL